MTVFLTEMGTFLGLVKSSLNFPTSPAPTAASLPTTVAAGLFSTQSATATATTQYWALGYYYQSGFDKVKTACIADPLCDWNTWSGYDGMLFVVNWTNMTSGGTSAGYYAICFPNPIGTQGGISNTGLPAAATFTTSTAFLPQSCIGFSLTLTAAAGTDAASTVVNVRGSALAAASTATPFYFINLIGAAVGISMASTQTLSASQVVAAVLTTHSWALAKWDDCYTLIGSASTGYYMNALAANAVSIQPPFCFGFTSGAVTITAALAQYSAYTFVPTTLAVKLTSTPIMLGTAQANFNSITTLVGATSLFVNNGAVGTTPKMSASSSASGFLATPSYKTSVVYPTATVAKGASSLAMSLAAATVLATLF